MNTDDTPMTTEERQRVRDNLQALWQEMDRDKRTAFLLTFRLDAAGVPSASTSRERIARVPERRQEMTTLLMASIFDANHDAIPRDIGDYFGVGVQ
jgi:hypothetical protein